jgi:hypothetical protein
MAITKKPATVSAPSLEDLIARGGTNAVTDAEDPYGVRTHFVQMRLTASTIARIDAARVRRPVRVPRHMWLLEAIAAKLASDEAAAGREAKDLEAIG